MSRKGKPLILFQKSVYKEVTMNTIEQLKAMTNKAFARALTGVGIMGFPDDIWEVDESDIYTLLEERTNKFNPQKVNILLLIFYQMNEYLEAATGRCEVLTKEIAQYQSVINNKYGEFDSFWDKHGEDYMAGKIVSPPNKPNEEYYELSGYIEEAGKEIDNIKYKQNLYYYAIDILCSKLPKSAPKDVSSIFGDLYPKILPHLQSCIEKGVLDSNFQVMPHLDYTKGDKSLLASLLLEQVGIKTGESAKTKNKSFGYFNELWGVKNLSGTYFEVINRTGVFKHQNEIENLFR